MSSVVLTLSLIVKVLKVEMLILEQTVTARVVALRRFTPAKTLRAEKTSKKIEGHSVWVWVDEVAGLFWS